MARIHCSKCGYGLAQRARSCPHCRKRNKWNGKNTLEERKHIKKRGRKHGRKEWKLIETCIEKGKIDIEMANILKSLYDMTDGQDYIKDAIYHLTLHSMKDDWYGQL